jgi:hypothetical protein
MFAEVAAGRSTPQDAMSAYAAQFDKIYDKWRSGGKV